MEAFCLKALKYLKCCFLDTHILCALFGVLSENTKLIKTFPLCMRLEREHDDSSFMECNLDSRPVIFLSHRNHSSRSLIQWIFKFLFINMVPLDHKPFKLPPCAL